MAGQNRGLVWKVWLVGAMLATLLLGACGEEARPTPSYAGVATPLDSSTRPTVTPPFQAATNITPESSPGPTTTLSQLTRPAQTGPTVPNTPIIKPTPTAPTEAVLTSDDLGIGSWSDTEVLWSPKGDVFLLHILREGSDGDFYYVVRPPESIQSSFRLSRSVYGTMAWSPDGRYLSYIDRDSDGSSGPVKLIDTQRDVTKDRKLFNGPCTGANWLAPGKLVASCGLIIYQLLPDEPEKPEGPEALYKLENNRFPGSNIDLSLLFNALPSPDGSMLAMFGLRRQKGPLPLGEIAFFNLATKKLEMLDRNNRPVTLVDWTPDSKHVILRNLTGDWAVAYTFDFYLADPLKLKITQNLTKSNDKCDPVLGSKPECQGTAPSSIQSSRVVFAPDGERYFFTGLRYVARPNAPLATAERLSSNRLAGTKEDLVEKVTESAPGERIVSLIWLPNGHYFYSLGLGTASAKAVLDGKVLEVATASANRGSRVSPNPKNSPVPTKSGAGAVSGFEAGLAQAVTTIPPTTTAPPPTNITLQTTAVATTQAPTTTAPPETTLPPNTPLPTSTSAPRGTSLLGFETVTAQARSTSTPVPTRTTPDATAIASAYPRAAAFYMSPTGNWLLSIERVAAPDKVVQFQVRLIPFTLK